MILRIDQGEDHGKIMVRGPENCFQVYIHKTDLGDLIKRDHLGYNENNYREFEEFSVAAKVLILEREKEHVKWCAYRDETNRKIQLEQDSVLFTVVEATRKAVYAKKHPLVNLPNHIHEWSMSAGKGYFTLLFKGYVNLRNYNIIRKFECKTKEAALKACFGEMVGNTIYTSKPGTLIGQGGENIKPLSKAFEMRLIVKHSSEFNK
jgi:hypothetical protein